MDDTRLIHLWKLNKRTHSIDEEKKLTMRFFIRASCGNTNIQTYLPGYRIAYASKFKKPTWEA